MSHKTNSQFNNSKKDYVEILSDVFEGIGAWSYEARYDHRLHAILMVVQGMSCRKVA